MILYYPPTKSAIVCPDGCGGEYIESSFVKDENEAANLYLLIRHPFDRVKSIYWRETQGTRELKTWLLGNAPIPCSAFTRYTKKTLRLEHIKKDIEEHLGLSIPSPKISLPEIKVCMTSGS